MKTIISSEEKERMLIKALREHFKRFLEKEAKVFYAEWNAKNQ